MLRLLIFALFFCTSNAQFLDLPSVSLDFLPGIYNEIGDIKNVIDTFTSISNEVAKFIKEIKTPYNVIFDGSASRPKVFKQTVKIETNPRYFSMIIYYIYYKVVTSKPTDIDSLFIMYEPDKKTLRCPGMSEYLFFPCVITLESPTDSLYDFLLNTPDEQNNPRYIIFQAFFFPYDIEKKEKLSPPIGVQYYVTYPECVYWFIPNGIYLSKVSPYKDFFGMTCVLPGRPHNQGYACPPGQWLTCRSEESCTYLEYVNSWDYNNEQNIFRYQNNASHDNIPFGHCYPCVDGVNKYHYNNIKVPQCEISPALTGNDVCRSYVPSKDVDKIYCLGFRAPPQKCPVNTIANSDRSGCVCVPGYYKADSDCLPCPVGYSCINGIKTVCGIDTYQSLTGQTACLDCVDSNGYSMKDCPLGRNLVPARCHTKEVGGVTDVTYVKNIECVPCSTCRNNIISKYIDSNVLNEYIECYI